MIRPWSVLAAASALMALGVACDRRGGSEPARSASRSRPAAALTGDTDAGLDLLAGFDGGLLEAPLAPLSGALAACVSRVGRGTPPELAAAIEAVEYPSIAEDACRLDLGVATHDASMCARISLTSLRTTCLWRTAIVKGATDECPGSIGERGRDPVCVALASHNPGLCAAARASERVRCLALARLDPARCNAADPLLRPACHRDLAALRPHLAPRTEAALPAGTAHLRVTFDPATDAGQVREYEMDVVVARGAYVTGSRTLYLVDPGRGWPAEFASSLFDHSPIVGFTVDLPARAGAASVRDARVILPDGLDLRPLATSGPIGAAQLTQIGGGRGRPVAGTLTAELVASGRPVRVELEFRTFVRDVVEAADLAAR